LAFHEAVGICVRIWGSVGGSKMWETAAIVHYDRSPSLLMEHQLEVVDAFELGYGEEIRCL